MWVCQPFSSDMTMAHTSISPCPFGSVIPGTAACARPTRWRSRGGSSSHQRTEGRPNGSFSRKRVGWLHVLDHGAADFVRHILQAVHHRLKAVHDFQRDPHEPPHKILLAPP